MSDLEKRDEEAEKSAGKAKLASETGDKKAHSESEQHAIKSINHEVAANARASEQRKK